MTVSLVAVAAVMGGLARWRLTVISWRPLGTFVANITGAFALGVLAATAGDNQTIVGLAGLGALTTVAGLVDDAVTMRERGRASSANAYVVSTTVLGIMAAWIGLKLAL
ncbi:MAG: CrcB family protein [Actinomycetota bacterium]|jgi:CrcB protein|nr:CrcB family protein [Actinomycetota bacterium]